MRRLSPVLVALLASLVVVVSPAKAEPVYATQSTLAISTPTGEFGNTFHPTGNVVAAPGAPAGEQPGGAAFLERLMAGENTWVKVTEQEIFGDLTFSVNYEGNAQYRIHYEGGGPWGESYSNAVIVTTYRSDEAAFQKKKGKKFFLQGYAPGWEGKKVKILEKERCKGCGWHVLKKVRTTAFGDYKTRVPASTRGIFHRVVIPASPRFPTYNSKKFVAIVLNVKFNF